MPSKTPKQLQDLFNQIMSGNGAMSSKTLATYTSAENSRLSNMGMTYYYPPTPKQGKPMAHHPTEFKVDDRVTLRSGKTIYTVTDIDERPEINYPVIFVVDETNNKTQSALQYEVHLAEPATPKVKVDFDTVIIEDAKRQQILEALEQIHQSDLIFKVWGFGETMEKGKGVSMLFYGPPGTGKTLMAQAIANKLGYTLKVISTADVQSSAPGEAERNIRKHFKEAKGGKTILLFDECDSLIYTREHVGPIMGAQINELLSQIERFDGITLFTTNRLGTLDEAVNRRLALKLEFAMPSPSERAEIWQRMFPKQCPLADDIDWLTLASIEITGGYIKNAVLRAARMAAIEPVHDSKKKISMKHLVKALKLEAGSMIEFEDARDKHHRGVGHVEMTSSGEGQITRG